MLKSATAITTIALSLSIFCSCGAWAQGLNAAAPSTALPVAKAPDCTPKKDPSQWDKSVTAAMSYTDGNSNTTNLNANAKLARDFENNVWRFEIDHNFGRSSSEAGESRVETKNDVKAVADYRRIFDEIYFGGFGTEVKHDNIADLKYRAILNPALGMYLIRDTEAKVSLEAGPSYIFEKQGDEDNNYLAPRVADRVEWKLSETAKIFQTAEVLFDASDSDNYLINSEVGIEAAVTSLVNLVVLVRDNYDNLPAPGKERNDVALITGLKLNF